MASPAGRSGEIAGTATRSAIQSVQNALINVIEQSNTSVG
ncbi:hypothetical protein GGD38_003441 [Chitinophagaceae bacterium OAS944]|nr:hypothetical protein [Chitinophagaceae bacterium OAS944]